MPSVASARGDVEQIVDHLEGQADVAAAARHRLDDRIVGGGQIRRGARADLEQRRRLARDDLEVVVERDRRVVPEAALHDLALGERDAGLGGPMDQALVEAAADLKGAAEEKVAGDQRLGARRTCAAPSRGRGAPDCRR